MTTAQPPLERLGTALADRYRIERELGAGGMANGFTTDGRVFYFTIGAPESDIWVADLTKP